MINKDNDMKLAMEGAHPETPVFSNLRPARLSYGQADPFILFDDALERNYSERRPQIISYIGPPMSGKSTLMSEQVNVALYYLTSKYLNDSSSRGVLFVPKQRFKVVAFEDSQNIVKGSFPRDDDDSSPKTKRHYEIVNNFMADSVKRALAQSPDCILFVESPGLLGRGDAVLRDIALKQNGFENFEYDDSYFLITMGATHDARKVRRSFGQDPGIRADALEEAGTLLHLDEGISTIGGGPEEAVDKFYVSLAKYFYSLVESGEVTNEYFKQHATGPDFFKSPAACAVFLEWVYSEKLFGRELGVDPGKVFVGRNRRNDSRILYQLDLNRYNTQLPNLLDIRRKQ